jgi:predicted nucleic acid-binding protein
VAGWLKGKEIVLCPLSELGFVRISSNPRVFGFSMADVRQGLDQFVRERNPGWIAADLRTLDSHPATSGQVTDHYLADLAARHGMKLATLDGDLKHPSAELVS